MKRFSVSVATFLLFATSLAIAEVPIRFTSVDVFIDSPEPMAAWQIEFAATSGAVQVVGVENGESDVFGDAPYYDREAVLQGRSDRIIVADYSLENEDVLPEGRVRVTTLHLKVSGDDVPDFDTQLVVAASFHGNRIDAEISFDISDGSEK